MASSNKPQDHKDASKIPADEKKNEVQEAGAAEDAGGNHNTGNAALSPFASSATGTGATSSESSNRPGGLSRAHHAYRTNRLGAGMTQSERTNWRRISDALLDHVQHFSEDDDSGEGQIFMSGDEGA